MFQKTVTYPKVSQSKTNIELTGGGVVVRTFAFQGANVGSVPWCSHIKDYKVLFTDFQLGTQL